MSGITVLKTNKARLKPVRAFRPGVLGKTNTAYLYLIPLFAFLAFFTYYAMAFNVQTSFFKWNGVSKNRTFIWFDNYVSLFKDPYFKISMKNTLLYFLVTIPVQAVFGFILALVFQESRLKLRSLTRSIVFLPNIMSLVVIGYIFNNIFNINTGVINATLRDIGLGHLTQDWLGSPATALWIVIIANIYTYIGFSMTLYIGGIIGMPHDIMEASYIDGCSRWQNVRYITLPMLISTHITILIMGLVGTLKTFDIVWQITQGGPARMSEMPATFLYRAYIMEYKAGYAAAVAVIVLLVALTMCILNLQLQKRARI